MWRYEVKIGLESKHPGTAARLWRTRVAASGYDGGWLMQPQRLQALG